MSTPTESRIQPATAPYPARIQAELERIMPAGVEPLLLFRTLARDERLFERFFAAGLLDRGHLGLRQRELAILRTTARCGAEYEWGVHVTFFAARAGLDERDLEATCAIAAGPEVFQGDELLILRLMDQLHDHSAIDPDLWGQAASAFSAEQLLELILLAGFYHTVSFLTNGLTLPLEPYAARFPHAEPRDSAPRGHG